MILYKAVIRSRKGIKCVRYCLYEVISETKCYYVIDHQGKDKRIAKESKAGLFKATKKGAAEGLLLKLRKTIECVTFSPFLRSNPSSVRAIQENMLTLEKELIRLKENES